MKHCPRCDEEMRWYPLPAGGGYWLCGHCGKIILVAECLVDFTSDDIDAYLEELE